ncbi:MAG: permease prefix domain 2-containing transporter [Vicinamibacterales bacterium]
MPNPPDVAELLLNALMPVDTRESVSGDLLEEYRESRVPASGELRADLWYWRQVGGLWMRTYWWLVVPAVLLLVVHDVFNTFRAPSGASYLDGLPRLVRAVISPLGVVGLLGLATTYGSCRTQRWQGGFVASLGVSVIVWLFMAAWGNATFYSFARVSQSNPYWVQAWQWSIHRGGLSPSAPEETFLHWMYWDGVGALLIAGIVLLVTSFVLGGIGAILGAIISHRRRVAREKF